MLLQVLSFSACMCTTENCNKEYKFSICIFFILTRDPEFPESLNLTNRKTELIDIYFKFMSTIFDNLHYK